VDPGTSRTKQERETQKRIGSEQQTDSDGILPNKEKCACPEAQGAGASPGKATHRRGKAQDGDTEWNTPNTVPNDIGQVWGTPGKSRTLTRSTVD